jgi:hypothetical protein
MNELNQQADAPTTPGGRQRLGNTLESLTSAVDAFKNVRAIILLGLTFISAALIGAAFSALAMSTQMLSLGAFGGLLAMLVVFYGMNAVGILMMRDAQGQPMHDMSGAVLLSLFSSHRVLAVFFLECCIMLLAVLAIVLVLLVCKIPVLGPVLYTVVFPVSAIILGVLVFALFWVMLPLTGPAVWNGGSVFQVIARLNLIVRARLIEVVLSQLVLFIMAGFVAVLIFSVIGTGVMMTAGISVGVIGSSVGSAMGGGMMGMMMGGGGGYAIAASLGGGLLMAVAAVVPALILTKGICIIYLNTTRDLDFTASEALLGDGLAAVKRRADEARERARHLAEQHRPATPASSGAVTAPGGATSSGSTSVAPGLQCPNCHAPVAADDAFCGNCAHKLG